jgi:CxxC motif-containing protein (DUF1111 family)
LLAVVSCCACSGSAPSPLGKAHAAPGVDRPDLPLARASAAELERFARGDDLFESTFRDADGLGPLYVRASCVACHRGDARGPGRVGKIGVFATQAGGARVDLRALLPFGATERPYVSAGARTAIRAPDGDARLRVNQRLPPAVFGRGYLEAVDDAAIERLAALAARRPGPIRGRIHRVADASDPARSRIGRFGLKARIATLDEFTADAFSGDMGLSSARHPREAPNPDAVSDDAKPGVDVPDEVVARVADYVRLLEIPSRDADEREGRAAFERAACATCHVPSLPTRRDYPVAALSAIDAPVYTDFLLHDMGRALADGVVEGDAGGREWRTAPLIGLRFFPAFLHDGRAKTIEAAVLAHAGEGSEANDTVERFRALTPAQRKHLLAFVARL